MNATDFEYAIKKDVRNNPIIREVDEARQRQLLRAVGIGALLVAVLLFSAWQHFELVQHGYLMERLQQERAAEEEINRLLEAADQEAHAIVLKHRKNTQKLAEALLMRETLTKAEILELFNERSPGEETFGFEYFPV